MGMTHLCRWVQPFLAKDMIFTIQAAIPGIGIVFGGIYLCAGETSVLVESTVLFIFVFFASYFEGFIFVLWK